VREILVRYTRDPLFGFSPKEVEGFLQTILRPRVEKAFLFGSFVRNELSPTSDIDLLIVTDTDLPFPVRGVLFDDLRDTLPSLQIIVYTPEEFSTLTKDPSPGFWTSLTNEMVSVF
jgi:predicted nucleotidyltransferase